MAERGKVERHDMGGSDFLQRTSGRLGSLDLKKSNAKAQQRRRTAHLHLACTIKNPPGFAKLYMVRG